jgi:hypothetical protein
VGAAVATIARPAGNQQNNSSFGVQHSSAALQSKLQLGLFQEDAFVLW